MGNKLRHEGDEVRIKVIWPDTCIYIYVLYIYIYLYQYRVFINLHTYIQRLCETINHPIFIVLHELFMFSTEF